MVEWDFRIQEVRADQPMNIPGWEPISVATIQGALIVRFFVLLRHAR